MKRLGITILSIFISFVIVISSLMLFVALLLNNTIYSKPFYQRVISSPEYVLMIKKAAHNNFFAQSSYVAIPVEIFLEGLDDLEIKKTLDNHIDNTISFMKFEADFKKSEYPAELFIEHFDEYVLEISHNEKYEPSEEQYDLLVEVAKDSAVIVGNHTNIINLDLVKNAAEFKILHSIIFRFKNFVWPSIFVIVFFLALLAMVHIRKKDKIVLFAGSAFWITGALLLIPSIVLHYSGIARRLAISTQYLKYAVDTWMTAISNYALRAGLLLFVVSSVVLILRIVLTQKNNVQPIDS